MITNVQRSMPRYIDDLMARRALEQCNGDVDAAVEKLQDMEDGSSVSSHNGSSGSAERDLDSDDDSNSGPKKKQDRRLSRATKAMRRVRAETQALEAAADVTNTDRESSPQSETVSLPLRTIKATKPRLILRTRRKSPNAGPENEDDGDLIAPSDDTDDGEFKPDVDDDKPKSEYSSTSRAQSRASTPASANLEVQAESTKTAKTAQKQDGPQRRRPMTARETQAIKKAAQKAARKESRRNGTKSQDSSNSASNSTPPLNLGHGMKALFI
jgi:OTU domain-containing protein 3